MNKIENESLKDSSNSREAPAVIELPVSDVIMGKRFRKDNGNLRELADSISKVGLLQPIGVTAQHELVFGGRRFLAARDILNWKTIPARIVNLKQLVIAEHDENEIRKAFTPSERVAIAEQIKRELSKGHGGDRRSADQVQNIGHEKADDIAARHSGFGNPETLRQATNVVRKGAPELVEAMDKGDASPSAAAAVAELPTAEQKRIVAGGKNVIKAAAKLARATKKTKRKKKTTVANSPETFGSKTHVENHSEIVDAARGVTSGSSSPHAQKDPLKIIVTAKWRSEIESAMSKPEFEASLETGVLIVRDKPH